MGTDPCLSMTDPTLPSPGEVLAALRTDPPLVQCLTNTVVQQFTANLLLALGASPAMDDIPGEAGVFAEFASGVLVNLGTVHADEAEAMRQAVAGAARANTPWVLDPVAIGVLPVRTALAHELAARRPGIVRGNASEIAALAGAGQGGRGTDATDSPEDVVEAAVTLARSTGAAVAVSGPTDLVTDGESIWRITGGSELLTRVTGGGCALGAVVAAVAGVLASPLQRRRAMTRTEAAHAAVVAHALYALAAERATRRCAGPGSFAVALLDELAALDPADAALGASERISLRQGSAA